MQKHLSVLLLSNVLGVLKDVASWLCSKEAPSLPAVP